MDKHPRTYEGKTEIKIEHPDMIICRCEEVTLAQIIEAISEGARTVDEVKRRTRAGMGLCQGRTCSRLVRHLLAQHTGQNFHQIPPMTARVPVRPIALEVLASLEDDTNG